MYSLVQVKMPIQTTCGRCGYISSAALCKACIMLDGLNRGRPQLSIGKNNKRKKILKQEADKLALYEAEKVTGSVENEKSSVLVDDEKLTDLRKPEKVSNGNHVVSARTVEDMF